MTVVGGRRLGTSKDPEGVLTNPGQEVPVVDPTNPIDPPIPEEEKRKIRAEKKPQEK
jgi:hypothetical protein